MSIRKLIYALRYDEEEGVILYFNDADFWKKKKGQVESYDEETQEFLNSVVKAACSEEIGPGEFQIDLEATSVEDAKEVLDSMGVDFSESYQKFVDSFEAWE